MSTPHRRHVEGIALTVHEAAGEPQGTVLLLHGIGGSAETFAGVAPRLAAAGWHTLAWDAPGYGASADPGTDVTGPDSPGAYVAAVEALLTALEVERAHLVGVSWGGVIATHVAARRPELVASLTLLDSTRGSGTTPAKAAAMRGRVTELVEVGPEAFAALRAPRLLAERAAPDVAAAVTRQMAAVRVPGYAGAAEMMAQSDTGPLLAALQPPTLVLVGDEDRVTGVAESRLLAREIPGACLTLIEGAGHAAVQERPAEVADALLGFWAGQPAPQEVLR
ncbi:MAG TPA: alpha/beta hydrolase [Marmoricola sp.]|nr:alpha/beta hydrolase [Marmoricola sp.]